VALCWLDQFCSWDWESTINFATRLRLNSTTATRPDFVGDPGLRLGSPTKSGRVADLSGLVGDFSGFFGSQTWSVQSRHVRIFCRVEDKSGRVWSGRSSGI